MAMEMQLAVTSATGLPRRARGAYYAIVNSAGGKRMCTEPDAEARWRARFTLALPCAGADESWSLVLRVVRKGARILGGQTHREVGSIALHGKDLIDYFRYAPAHVRGLRCVSFRLNEPSGRPSPVIVNMCLSMYGLGLKPASAEHVPAPALPAVAVSGAPSHPLTIGHSCALGIPVAKAVPANLYPGNVMLY